MADLWTSAHTLLGSIMKEVKGQAEGYKVMASALQHKEKVVQEACHALAQELAAKSKAYEDLLSYTHTLEGRLGQAQEALWKKGQEQANVDTGA
jgi:Skp family chaperone for outer membrane proteins